MANTGPLAGIRVVDLTSVVLGPMATHILADYGADVIKIESADGDVMRGNGTRHNNGLSSIFLNINRNKRCMGLDLKQADAKEVLKDLLRSADVFIHNMRLPAIERLGFGYDDVKAINPGIVYCVGTGYDQNGPLKDRPAFDDTIQAACGLVGITSSNSEPKYIPTLVADKTAGIVLANAVLAALVHKGRSGAGQFVEVPMFETLVWFTLVEHLGGLAFEGSTAPAGYQRLLEGGRRSMPTKDGFIAILAYTIKHRKAFFEAVGRPELAAKYGQKANGTIGMYDEIAKFTPEQTTDWWLELCEKLDIPATTIMKLEELPQHPQLQAVGLFETHEHPTEGKVRTVRSPVKFAQTPAGYRSHAPQLGEQTREILTELGYDNTRIDGLLSIGAALASSSA